MGTQALQYKLGISESIKFTIPQSPLLWIYTNSSHQ